MVSASPACQRDVALVRLMSLWAPGCDASWSPCTMHGYELVCKSSLRPLRIFLAPPLNDNNECALQDDLLRRESRLASVGPRGCVNAAFPQYNSGASGRTIGASPPAAVLQSASAAY